MQSADLIIFPIWNDSHWLFGGFDLKKNEIVVADSKRLYAEKFLDLFRKTESEITKIFKSNLNVTWTYTDLSSSVPYQLDGSSCGPLSVLNAQLYTKNMDFHYCIDQIIDKLRRNICFSTFIQLQQEE